MGFLTTEDQAARDAALETKRQQVAAHAEAVAARMRQISQETATEHQAARQAIVDELFASLRRSFLKGDDPYVGTTCVGKKYVPRPRHRFAAQPGARRHPVFAVLSEASAKEESQEMVAIQALVDEIDDSYVVSYLLKYSRTHGNSGPLSLVTSIEFTLSPREV